MTFNFRCPSQHESGSYQVTDDWFLFSQELPLVFCKHCGHSCELKVEANN